MTGYSSTASDTLLDVALEAMGSGQPVQFRRTNPEGQSEYAVGLITAAYYTTSEMRGVHVTTVTVGGIPLRVHATDEWEAVVHDDPPRHDPRHAYAGPGAIHTADLRRVQAKPLIPAEMVVEGHTYPVLQPGEGLPDTEMRALPVTESQWTHEHQHYEGANGYEPPRLVLVEWEDPTETPTECIQRINSDVHAASQRESRLIGKLSELESAVTKVEQDARPHWALPEEEAQPVYPVSRDSLLVHGLRWYNGSAVEHHEAIVLARTSESSYKVQYTLDGYISMALGSNIRATTSERAKLEAMPITPDQF
jgi:hypothetical protein